ncbi:MAG: hypothetical protein ACRC2Y_04915 [Aeromonas veronii]
MFRVTYNPHSVNPATRYTLLINPLTMGEIRRADPRASYSVAVSHQDGTERVLQVSGALIMDRAKNIMTGAVLVVDDLVDRAPRIDN